MLLLSLRTPALLETVVVVLPLLSLLLPPARASSPSPRWVAKKSERPTRCELLARRLKMKQEE
jgi:hypothetical protein